LVKGRKRPFKDILLPALSCKSLDNILGAQKDIIEEFLQKVQLDSLPEKEQDVQAAFKKFGAITHTVNTEFPPWQ
jgi:hypothetical protein